MLTPPDSPPLLEARYQLDEGTARAAFRDLLANVEIFRRCRRQLAVSAVVIVMMGLLLFVMVPNELAGVMLCLWVGAAYLWSAWRFPRSQAEVVVKMAPMDAVPGPRQIEVADGVITESADHHYRAYRLAKVYNVRQTPEFLAVWMTQGELIAIPADADFGSKTFDAFARELRELIASAKQTAPVLPTV
jgi:hypothetical protein